MSEPILSCADLIRAQYGVDVYEEESLAGAVVNVAGGILVKNRPYRVALLVINLSVNTFYLRPTGPATATRGISIVGPGSFMSINFRDDMVLPAREWWAASTLDASPVYVLETLIMKPQG
jgi:hypothetical protein